MEYMEQQMQNYIEAGISEADQCYARIAELEEQNLALAAQVEALREQLQTAHDCITCADETGYVQDVGFVDLEQVALGIRYALTATPPQHLAEIRAEAQSGGWQEYCWPEKVPPSKHEFYVTDVGCLFYDNGAWLEPAEYNGWNPTSAKVTKFFVVPEEAAKRKGEVE